MGNEESTVVDDSTPPSVLESRTMEGVAKYIKDHEVKKIVVMVGAGISTSAGIPDFRSPDTGLYANLEFLDLEEPEQVFDISFFRENPKPFYALAKELYPGRYRPTIAHSFIKLLYDKGMLLKHFTQNIDCLERQAGVPGDMIKAFPDDQMREHVAQASIPHCPDCNGLVKPDIVFFGEALPREFFEERSKPELAELCIVMGTSLTVHPFASLPMLCREGTPRVLINMEKVGGLGSRADDVLLLGDCDAGVRKFAKAMGWEEELEALWEKTNPDPKDRERENAPLEDRDEQLKREIERLTEDVDRTLDLSGAYQDRVRARLGQSASQSSSSSPESGLGHVFPHFGRRSH
ncbi:NAD-dependent protein deacetylase hst2-1 [Penicillium chermesinum]|nr:NAD-dependent protein deacetylase hst2-1 [Penicillium chermesinum]